MSDLVDRLTEQAGVLAREDADLRTAAAALCEAAEGDEDALRESQRRWAQVLHDEPENGDALGALVLAGAALHLMRDDKKGTDEETPE